MRAATASVAGPRVEGFAMRRTASCLARAMHGAAQRAAGVSPPFRPVAPRRAFAAASADDTSSASAWRPAPLEPVTSAYVHLPFCRRRCYYCDFAISVVGDGVESDAVRRGMEAYVDRVCREIRDTPLAPSTAAAAGNDWPLRTVFFGGGTPSLVPPDLLRRVVDALRARFGLAPDAEVSMEMDPGTFDRAKLDGYLRSGVTRVSLGAQSFDADVLKLAGRAHTVQESRAACAAVAEALRDAQAREDERVDAASKPTASKKLFSWSLDLISGLPGLTRDAWRASLAEAVAFSPDHVSVYDLQIEEGTPFWKWYEPGVGPMPREEDGAAMFRDASRALNAAGFEHYEVSSYARAGARCRHNQVYWNSGRQGWYAFGMAATSHVDAAAERVARPRKMRDWESWVDAMPPLGATLKTDATWKTDADASLKTGDVAAARASALMERLMLGLRTRDGLDLDALAAEFGRSVPDEILAVLAEQPEGLAVVATRDVERDAADETFSSFSLKNQDDERDGVSRLAGAVVRLTDPEGLMVSTEVISTLIARMPSLEAL